MSPLEKASNQYLLVRSATIGRYSKGDNAQGTEISLGREAGGLGFHCRSSDPGAVRVMSLGSAIIPGYANTNLSVSMKVFCRCD